MDIGVSVLIAAVGALLRWGVTSWSWDGFHLEMAGTILVLAGTIGVVISLAFWRAWGRLADPRHRPAVRHLARPAGWRRRPQGTRAPLGEPNT